MDSSALFIGLLQSRTLQDRLIERFELKEVYRDRTWEDARIDLEKHSKITADDKNGIITVRVWDVNPDRAAALVQGRMDELNLLVTRLVETSEHSERVFLENWLVQVWQDLESAQKELSKYASNNLLSGMDGQEQVIIQTLGQVQQKLIVDQGELEDRESMYLDGSAQDRATQPDMPARDNVMIKVVIDVQGKMIADQADLESLKERYTAANIQVRSTQAKVSQLRWELAKLVGKSIPSASARQNPRSLFPSLHQLPMIGNGYADLFRAVAVDEARFDTLAQEDELAKVREVRNTPGIAILDPPDVPENKSWPLRLWIIFLSTFGSLSLAVTWIFGTVWWQRWPEDGKLFAIEVFQTVGAYFRLGVKKRGSVGRVGKW